MELKLTQFRFFYNLTELDAGCLKRGFGLSGTTIVILVVLSTPTLKKQLACHNGTKFYVQITTLTHGTRRSR